MSSDAHRGRGLSDWLRAAEAVACLAVARGLTRNLAFRHWRRWIAEGRGASSASPADERCAQRVGIAVARAARRVPFRAVCLHQALAARWMLARRGIDATLRIGAGPAATDRTPVRLHAWLLVGQQVVTGHAGQADFVAFSRGEGSDRPVP